MVQSKGYTVLAIIYTCLVFLAKIFCFFFPFPFLTAYKNVAEHEMMPAHIGRVTLKNNVLPSAAKKKKKDTGGNV